MLPTAEFRALCEIEPTLRELYEQARKTPQSRWYACQDGRKWIPGLVEQLEVLVGFSAQNRHPTLITSASYDLCYRKMHAALKEQ